MRIKSISIVAIVALMSAFAVVGSAQIKVPRPSQKASIMQTIGVTDVSIVYFRPGIKGRKVFGDSSAPKSDGRTLDDARSRSADEPLVAYGHVWRTGANDATLFTVTDDVLINGQVLSAGSYSLHTIPGKTEWTIVFNGTANQWGSFNYDPSKDQLRVKVKPMMMASSQEWMIFTIDPVTENKATVNLMWEKVHVAFEVEVKDVVAATMKNAEAQVASASADDWRTPFTAANYANQNKRADKANEWLPRALKAVDLSIAAKPTWANLSGKVNILLAMGKNDEAIALSDRAFEAGRAEKADISNLERRIQTLKQPK